MTDPLHLFASCLPGLESLLAGELENLGLLEIATEAGGVAFRGDVRDVFGANLWLGTASHVLLRCGAFHCRSLGELARKSAQLPWGEWLHPDVPLSVRAKAKRSRLIHTGAIAERVSKGITDVLGAVPPEGEEGAAVTVRFLHDECTISLDTSGDPLHRRGWRQATAKAPLREDLAHALVLASGWDTRSPLLDPFCGAGTIPIEAAGLARRLAPGRLRSFALERTALGDESIWHELREVAASEARPTTDTTIAASDRDAGACRATESNAMRAGVLADLTLRECSFSDAAWLADPDRAPETGTVVTNPPFGRRIGTGRSLVHLYQSLGHRLQQLSGWRTALLAQDRRLVRRTGLDLQTAFVVDHGGLKVTGMVGEVR